MFEDLRHIDRFAELPDEVLEELAARGRFQKRKRGETLFFEGDDCTLLYIVVEGSVKIAKTLESGKELIIDILGPGEGVGEVALIDDLPYPATAIAHTDTVTYVLPRTDYFALLEKYPPLPRAIIRDLAQRLRVINRRMKDVSGGNVEYRIAHLLLTLADRVGTRAEDGVSVEFSLSRQEIADMVGTTIETAIRVMSRWSKDGIVETTRKGFLIKDTERLEEIALSSL